MERMDLGAETLLRRLNTRGYEAYVVGGCVRDLLRGVTPHDWDICTSALPGETKAVCSEFPVVETGLQHGTVTVLLDSTPYEVTTYRVDGRYSDGRRPDHVTFTPSLTEDLARRDFTMNAIAMDVEGNLVDPFGGRSDIENGVVRCVGEPDRRFREDGLRVMRGLRFAATLGYAIHPETAAALHRCRAMLEQVAAERIWSELKRLLTGSGVLPVLLDYPDVLSVFWPELGEMVGFDQRNPWHCWDVWEHTARAVAAVPAEVPVRLAMLLHDVGKPRCCSVDKDGVGHFYGHAALSAQLAEEMLHRLRSERETARAVVELVKRHDLPLSTDLKLLRRRLNQLGEERLLQLVEVQRGDALAQTPELVTQRLEELEEIKEAIRQLIAEGACTSVKMLAVTGRDLMEGGWQPGPALGARLQFLLDQVLDGKLPNQKEALLSFEKESRQRKLP